MYATIFSILISLFILFNPFQKNVTDEGKWLGIALIIIACVFFTLQCLVFMMAWSPLQKAEKNFTPRILQAFQRDRRLYFIQLGLLFFLVITFVIASDLLYFNLFNKTALVAAWIVFLGIAVDLMSIFMRRILGYLNPFSVIDHFLEDANKSIIKEDEGELCEWIDALSEVAIKATEHSSSSLANHAISKMPHIAENYFNSAKSIGYQKLDKALYTLYYILQRLALVHHKAIERHLEPVNRYLINSTSKIAVMAAKFDITTASVPIRFVGDFAIEAQKNGMVDVGDYASCALIEVARRILEEVDITYLEIKDSFFTLINQLEAISKETFRQDKNINMKILNQPFSDLRALFITEKMAKHQDTSIILQDINRVMGEFDALGMVMRTIPPIPKMDEPPST